MKQYILAPHAAVTITFGVSVRPVPLAGVEPVVR
jgi:hypothetical protein